ncbi:hypothetical protein BUALT_Bualt15G0011600 [Buddleja alternifolia]|uniref:MULE transposase domain-containing protein n=1 Tax=Buddleja alternifolia TaxID=168488 RepID=A0AAV6WMB0_9LAMI|nr:hypothetical protein BUALT_Bualt15G0011600 [Buddleja alternifolia]
MDTQSDPTYQGGGDDEEESLSDSSLSDCPDWMFEDFEGPEDDDIFASRAPDHARKLFKTLRAFVKSNKKQRAEERQNEENERNRERGEWYSEVDEDDLQSKRGSDDEGGPDSLVWSDDTDMRTFEMVVGLQFPTRKKYREILRDWAVRKWWDLKFLYNETAKITATCKHGCDWRIHASPIMKTSTYQVKSLRESHTCAHRYQNRQANYKYLGKRIENIIRDNPMEGLESLKNKIRRDVEVECSRDKLYRAKRYALELVKGDIKVQYHRLYDYYATVVKHNPTSNLILQVDRNLNPLVLQKMYFCLASMREGFLACCRPIIGLDGCFLKGMYKGQLLIAIGRDGNDNIFPIAIAYVEIEKEETWKWFLSLLLRDIGSADEKGWAFISDRQKGLVEAVHSLAPTSEHRFCLKHMYNNFKGKYRGRI